MLDTERNLVVGIVCETWMSDASMKDTDTAWAVNARVMGLAPLGLPLRQETLPLGGIPAPAMDSPSKGASGWTGVPPPPREWVGREDLLKQLDADWNDPGCRIAVVVGIGGVGKSGVARQWFERVNPVSVFWWNFTNGGVDQYFVTALRPANCFRNARDEVVL